MVYDYTEADGEPLIKQPVAAHTKGPWRSGVGGIVWRTYTDTAGRRCHQPIAAVNFVRGMSADECAANERLIVASPDILAALYLMLEPYVLTALDEINGPQRERVAAARAAIAIWEQSRFAMRVRDPKESGQ